MSSLTPSDVISGSIYAVDEQWGRNEPSADRIRQDYVMLIMEELRIEFDTITMNGQRYLLLPEPSPHLEAAA